MKKTYTDEEALLFGLAQLKANFDTSDHVSYKKLYKQCKQLFNKLGGINAVIIEKIKTKSKLSKQRS